MKGSARASEIFVVLWAVQALALKIDVKETTYSTRAKWH